MSLARQTVSEFAPVPQMDLAAQYAAIGAEIREAVSAVLASQQFVLGKECAALEHEIAKLRRSAEWRMESASLPVLMP